MKGAGVQMSRKECMTEACRALFPGDEVMPEAVQLAMSEDAVDDVEDDG